MKTFGLLLRITIPTKTQINFQIWILSFPTFSIVVFSDQISCIDPCPFYHLSSPYTILILLLLRWQIVAKSSSLFFL